MSKGKKYNKKPVPKNPDDTKLNLPAAWIGMINKPGNLVQFEFKYASGWSQQVNLYLQNKYAAGGAIPPHITDETTTVMAMPEKYFMDKYMQNSPYHTGGPVHPVPLLKPIPAPTGQWIAEFWGGPWDGKTRTVKSPTSDLCKPPLKIECMKTEPIKLWTAERWTAEDDYSNSTVSIVIYRLESHNAVTATYLLEGDEW